MKTRGVNLKNTPLVSIVVCVFNDEKYIKACIESLLNQSYDNCEIIVVDDGSTDLTGKIASSFQEIHYIRQENTGPSAARNKGIQVANGRIICFIDSDCEADRRWVEILLETYQELDDERIVSVGGLHLGHPDDTGFPHKIDWFMSSIGFVTDYMKKGETVKKVGHNPSCTTSYVREALAAVGGFRENLFPGEDVDLDRRLLKNGATIYKNPAAIVFHHRPESLSTYSGMIKSYGYTSARLTKLHGVNRPIQLIPLLYLADLIVTAGLFLCLPVVGGLFLIFNVLMATLMLLVLKRPAFSYVELVAYLIITMNLYTLGYVKGLFASTRKIRAPGPFQG